MRIVTIDHQDVLENSYMFNPSICHVKDDLYLIVYRIIKYFIDGPVHPWKMWSNGYNYIMKHRPELIERNKHLGLNSKLYSPYKYRLKLGEDSVATFTSVQEEEEEQEFDMESSVEFDGTAASVVRILQNNDVEVVTKISTLFGEEMNQDCRVVTKDEGTHMLTYNGFLRQGGIFNVCMLTRDLYLDDTYRKCFLTTERFCCEDYEEKFFLKVEKNWSVVCKRKKEETRWINGTAVTGDLFLYKLGHETQLIDHTGQIIRVECPLIGNLIDHFGDTIQFSLGTPTLVFDEFYSKGYLSVGHLKVRHNTSKRTTANLDRFLKETRERYPDMKMHGNFIYMFFMMRFDANFRMTHISDAFVPTDTTRTSHMPYSLVFPTGLVIRKDDIIVSYGEGDVRAKLLFLSKDETTRLLRVSHTVDHTNFDYTFMSKVNKKIQVLGYYDKHNTGDDCFKVVFQWIASTFCPNVKLVFSNPYDIDKVSTKHVIVGGGDIINPYFIEKIRKCICTAEDNDVSVISVGTPYRDCVTPGYLNFAKRVWTRNECDIEFLEKTTYGKVAYFPDIVHLLPRLLPPKKSTNKKEPGNVSIAFCLTRTMYHRHYEKEYFNLVSKLSEVIRYMIGSGAATEVILIPFGIDPRSKSENDCRLHDHIFEMLKGCPEIDKVSRVIPEQGVNFDTSNPMVYAEYVDTIIREVDFAICARFHAHVFCMNRGVPFVSLSTTRKVQVLLDQWKVPDWKFDMKLSQYFSPIDFDTNELIQFINEKLASRATMKAHLDDHRNRVVMPLMDDFISQFTAILNE